MPSTLYQYLYKYTHTLPDAMISEPYPSIVYTNDGRSASPPGDSTFCHVYKIIINVLIAHVNKGRALEDLVCVS